jgi:sulfotransferase family protein
MRRLYLCGGLPSSGSTLISWCFLQRADMAGVLDADPDLIPSFRPPTSGSHAWYKTTLGCFRLAELAEHYGDYGWKMRPLLIVRDVRRIWASMAHKPYSRNGTTAEDPPWRLRCRRFLADWQCFHDRGWPMLRYESLLLDPETTLRRACLDLELDWDAGMLAWPKPLQAMGNVRGGSPTFWKTRGATLHDTLREYREEDTLEGIAPGDWHWLEREFEEFNSVNEYGPMTAPAEVPSAGDAAEPDFIVTRRYTWETRRKMMRWIGSLVGIPNRRLLASRSPHPLPELKPLDPDLKNPWPSASRSY